MAGSFLYHKTITKMTIKGLIDNVNQALKNERPDNQTTEEYTLELINAYLNNLSQLNGGECTTYSLDKTSLMGKVAESCNVIKEAFEAYSLARLAKSIQGITDFYEQNKGNFMTHTINAGDTWYRMRIREKNHKHFAAKDMFHIPFHLRGRVSSQRYSLPGYPCLYAGRSLWG